MSLREGISKFGTGIAARQGSGARNRALAAPVITTTHGEPLKALAQLTPQIQQLYISLCASPEFNEDTPKKTLVGYKGTTDDSTGELVIPQASLAKYFAPHRTVIIRATIPRYQADRVFQL